MSFIEFCGVAKNALIEIASKLLYRSNLFCFAYWLLWMEFGNVLFPEFISQRCTDLYNVCIMGTDVIVVVINEQ